MSILSEILSTGHVDQELLDALDDEQKQLLFCQMRAEQVRKWEAAEDKLEREGGTPKDPMKKQLKWLTGTDGEVWVWVMGDHKDDPSIDQIIDEETRQRAHTLAMREWRMSHPQQNNGRAFDTDEESLMAQLGSMKVGAGATDSFYDDDNSESGLLLFQPPRPGANQPTNVTATKVTTFNIPQPQKAEMVRGERPPLLPKPQGQFAQFTQMQPTTSTASMSQPIPSTTTNMSNGNSTSTYGGVPKTNGNGNGGDGRHPHEGLVVNGVRLRPVKIEDKAEDEVMKRESEIFQSLQEQRERLQREAEQEEARRRAEWEELQRKSREADAAMREMAQKAREQHRHLIRTSTSILPALKDKKASSLREAIKNLPRPPKPKSRNAIVEWFRRDELPRGTGLDPKTRAPAPWFHGIISRDQAEVLLINKPTGSYLVRVSERIWGYTVSYVVGDGTFKHFLVEKIPEGYQFLGTNQVVHDQLFDLVSYHETAPITAKGGEILKWSVGQVTRPSDYSDLMPDNNGVYGNYHHHNNGTANRTGVRSNGGLAKF